MKEQTMIAAPRFLAVALAGLLAVAGAQAACYTVMDAKGNILSQTSTPPVDMSRPLSETVPQRWGEGARMVFGSADESCGSAADPWIWSAGERDGRSQRAPRADRG